MDVRKSPERRRGNGKIKKQNIDEKERGIDVFMSCNVDEGVDWVGYDKMSFLV